MLKILAFVTERQGLETKAFLEHDETKCIPSFTALPPRRSSTNAATSSAVARSTKTMVRATSTS